MNLDATFTKSFPIWLPIKKRAASLWLPIKKRAASLNAYSWKSHPLHGFVLHNSQEVNQLCLTYPEAFYIPLKIRGNRRRWRVNGFMLLPWRKKNGKTTQEPKGKSPCISSIICDGWISPTLPIVLESGKSPTPCKFRINLVSMLAWNIYIYIYMWQGPFGIMWTTYFSTPAMSICMS